MKQYPVKPLKSRQYWTIRFPRPDSRTFQHLFKLIILLTLGALFGYRMRSPLTPITEQQGVHMGQLYLIESASRYVKETQQFAIAVNSMADRLNVAPEWLMAIMFAESGFNPHATNLKGSGAIGLIQFMPATAAELNITIDELKRMSATEQLPYVEAYLEMVKNRYGPYQNLTDLYLAVLFPRARTQQPCYQLYAQPARAYQQNAGLDENHDGKVTVHDIDRRLLRLFPNAYIATPT